MAKKSLKRGLFITFEGPEGSGKSTQAKLLAEFLKRRGYPVLHTREPGGTRLGELVRGVLLSSKNVAISDMAELFLFEACRSQIVGEAIRPALAKKSIVICDRYSDATISYQGYGGNAPVRTIKELNRIATGNLSPDLTILLDIDTLTGLGRAKSKGVDRMEKKDIGYHKRVRRGYLALAKQFPKRIKVIKVKGAIDQTQAAVRSEVELALERLKN
jgi:dTMP kinase